MLFEQIIKLELRELGSLGRICTPTAGYFYDKTKIFKENLRVDYCLQLKYCSRQLLCFSPYFGTVLSPTWDQSLTKFNLKMQNFKSVLNLSCKLK